MRGDPMTVPDLARRLVEHPRWTWQPGMRVRSADTVVAVEGHVIHISDGTSSASFLRDTGTLDLDHPATKGWLLHMLREATGIRNLHPHRFESGRWGVSVGGPWHLYRATEGEALAAALLAVWGGAA